MSKKELRQSEPWDPLRCHEFLCGNCDEKDYVMNSTKILKAKKNITYWRDHKAKQSRWAWTVAPLCDDTVKMNFLGFAFPLALLLAVQLTTFTWAATNVKKTSGKGKKVFRLCPVPFVHVAITLPRASVQSQPRHPRNLFPHIKGRWLL